MLNIPRDRQCLPWHLIQRELRRAEDPFKGLRSDQRQPQKPPHVAGFHLHGLGDLASRGNPLSIEQPQTVMRSSCRSRPPRIFDMLFVVERLISEMNEIRQVEHLGVELGGQPSRRSSLGGVTKTLLESVCVASTRQWPGLSPALAGEHLQTRQSSGQRVVKTDAGFGRDAASPPVHFRTSKILAP